jgi:predicted nucleic acid-binding Zn ribbon protein
MHTRNFQTLPSECRIMSISKKNRKTFTPIGTVIEDLLRQHRPATTKSMLDLWDVWQDAVGPDVSANTRPAAINGNVLLVNVSNSAWMHQLRFLEGELIQRLNLAIGKNSLTQLKFKIGPI